MEYVNSEQKDKAEKLRAYIHQRAVLSTLRLCALKEADLQTLLNETVSVVSKTLDMEYCEVLELLPDGKALLFRAGVGWKKGLVGHATVEAHTHSQAGYTLLVNGLTAVKDLAKEKRFEVSPIVVDHGIVSTMHTIVHGKGKPFGILGVHTSRQRTFTEYDKEFLQSIADMLTESIIGDETGEDCRKSRDRNRKTLEETIETLKGELDIRDPFTAGHEERVSELSCAIAKEMGLSEEQIEGIDIAGGVHDIGKIAITTKILSKPGKRTKADLEMIKIHSQVGYDILRGIEFPWPIITMVLQHHERLDGSGYPDGLKGDEIIQEARILAVADTVEAISSHRPYRPALGVDKALEEISKNKDILYDPEVVDACVRLFRGKGFEFKTGGEGGGDVDLIAYCV